MKLKKINSEAIYETIAILSGKVAKTAAGVTLITIATGALAAFAADMCKSKKLKKK